jgi:transposase
MGKYYVGLDVHSKQSTFVIEDAEGTVVAQGEVPTTRPAFERLCAAHHLPARAGVALETGTVAFFVARQVAALGLAPVVVDAHEVRLKAHRPNQKSDRRDAFERCEGLRPLPRCQARGELRWAGPLDLPVGGTRRARTDHQTRVGGAARDAL